MNGKFLYENPNNIPLNIQFSDFPENIAWYLLYLLFYDFWSILTAANNTWSSFVWQLKCRCWGCFFVSGKRNPRRRRQPSGRPMFYWEGERFGQTHPTIQQWIHREFYGRWKKVGILTFILQMDLCLHVFSFN